MKTAIIIPCYNRPKYLKQCLDSIVNTYLPADTLIYIVDDGSTDSETIRLIEAFDKGCEVKRVFNKENKGLYPNLITAYDYCFKNCYEYAIIVACDNIVNNYFYDIMTYYKSLFPNRIVSGFHTKAISELGKSRHEIIKDRKFYLEMKTNSGVASGIDSEIYETFLKPLLKKLIASKRKCYDTLLTEALYKAGRPTICTIPSVAEHVGIESTMNHSFNPDYSVDFRPYIELPIIEPHIVSVNLATYPPREQYAKQIIERLLTYEVIDKIRIYLNEYEQAPEWCKHEKIEYVIGGENLKDTGKFFWAGTYKNEYYFTIDDDLLYTEKYFENHIAELKNNSNNFISSHGKILKSTPQNFRDFTESWHCCSTVNENHYINFPGTGVMVFDNSKHKILLELFKHHGMTDLWIALFCQLNKITCILRKHHSNEMRMIYSGSGTLWNAQNQMLKQHKEILDSVSGWQVFTPYKQKKTTPGKRLVKFIRHWCEFRKDEVIELTTQSAFQLNRRNIVIYV